MQSQIDNLIQLGLTKNEAIVYHFLLESTEACGNEIAKQTNIDRSFTYSILQTLNQKGLVSHINKNNKKYFRPSSPDKLLSSLQDKVELANKVIPDLNKIKQKKQEKSEVTVYEGKEGLRELYNLFFKNPKDALFFGGTWKSYDVLKWEMNHLERDFKKLNIDMRGIISANARDSKFANLKNVQIKYAPGVDSNATTSIVGDMVSIHVLVGKPLIITIKNKEIVKGYRAYFEFMWANAKDV